MPGKWRNSRAASDTVTTLPEMRWPQQYGFHASPASKSVFSLGAVSLVLLSSSCFRIPPGTGMAIFCLSLRQDSPSWAAELFNNHHSTLAHIKLRQPRFVPSSLRLVFGVKGNPVYHAKMFSVWSEIQTLSIYLPYYSFPWSAYCRCQIKYKRSKHELYYVRYPVL